LILLLQNREVAAAPAELKIPSPRLPEAILKTVGPPYSLLRFNKVCKKGKVVTLSYERITVNTPVSVVKKISQYLAVTPQLGMNVSYIVILIAVNAVVVVIPALIGTEFLIRPAQEPGPAVKTYSFHSVMFDQIYKIFY
jgi:hypothetical protein